MSCTAILNGLMPLNRTRRHRHGGTADLSVAREAERTPPSPAWRKLIVDVGVAAYGAFDRIDDIRSHDVVIAVAGMDAAMAASRRIGRQGIIGVPTSVGYGVAAAAARRFTDAELWQGVLVTNIDNGSARPAARSASGAMAGERPPQIR